MPGSSLSTTERKLKEWWDNSTQFAHPPLMGLRLEGDPGLRGIRNLDVQFNYPLTVISGKNGCGKTTVLSLAALGFHSPEGHFPVNARRRAKAGENRSYYTFKDFFFKGPADPDIAGVEIDWRYGSDGSLKIRKQSDKWMHYERRPQRPVHYLGAIRSVPAIEQSVLRSHFGASSKNRGSVSLSNKYRARLGEIMGKSYEEAEVMWTKRYYMRRVSAGGFYSSFNMGAGEDALIDLLYFLQESPKGALVVVEEVELGLHPEALIRLAKHLQEIMLEKKLQVIVSTHSQHFIDSVPRQARLLLQRAHDNHLVTYEPTTRFAIGDLSGRSNPELHAYCEDNFASILVGRALTGGLRQRVRVLPTGKSESQLAAQGSFHLKSGIGQHMILIWDGDVTLTQAEAHLKRHDLTKEALNQQFKRVNWTRLPGDVSPEEWVIKQLDSEEGCTLLAAELGQDSASTRDLVEQARAFSDPHDVGPLIAERCNVEKDDALNALAASVSQLSSKPLSELSTAIRSVLEGNSVQGFA